MISKRYTLSAGVVKEYEFDGFHSNSIVVKNETADEILFCEGQFDAAKAAHIPAFSWQSFNLIIPYSSTPVFNVKSVANGDVEINFGSSCMGQLGNVLDVAGMISHTLTFTAGDNSTLVISLKRLHGHTLDLDAPVALTSGATVYYGDIISITATATEAGTHPVVSINDVAITLDEGSYTHAISGETVITAVAAAD